VTIAGFLPVGFARSTAGEYAGNIFWVVGFALIVSWIVAVVFTPYLGVKMLPAIKPIEGGHHAIYDTPNYRACGAHHLRRAPQVRPAVSSHRFRAFRRRHGRRQTAVLPDIRRPEVLVEVRLPEGTSIETTTATVEKLEHWLDHQSRPRSSRAMSVRALPASSSRWRRSCLIRPSPRSSCLPGRDAREALKHGSDRRCQMGLR
jgi:Cation/multidrug efflux pump